MGKVVISCWCCCRVWVSWSVSWNLIECKIVISDIRTPNCVSCSATVVINAIISVTELVLVFPDASVLVRSYLNNFRNRFSSVLLTEFFISSFSYLIQPRLNQSEPIGSYTAHRILYILKHCSISDITGVSGIFVGPIFPVGRNGIYSTVICKDRNETVV